MNEDFFILFAIVTILVLVFGFNSVNYKLKQKLKNDERIIERLDILINSRGKSDQ
ncbi:hypothetical protein [Cohnella cholangitidis]|uniref:hypothetical protein n=1 Tax=Cohnella cholangitidis TaxID=2598458 RepID=UPI0015FA436C|nr:hypothetical protein [Cohnella cholangitidis]